MMKLNYFSFLGLALFSVLYAAPNLCAQDAKKPAPKPVSGIWAVDYNKAVLEAKKTGKDLLMVFTGTDWIEICKRFDQEILSKTDFTDQISKRFVMVKLEFPREPAKAGAGNSAKQNQFLKSIYRVRGYPTLLLTDVDGRPYAITGFQRSTAKVYGDLIVKMQQGKEKKYQFLKAADSLTGLDKAKSLIQGIPELPGNLGARFFRPEMQAVIAADPENKTGKTEGYKKLIADVNYANQMSKLRKNVEWTKMLKLSDQYISQNQSELDLVQRVLMNKISVYQRLNNLEGIVASLLTIVKLDPKTKTAVRAQEVLDKLRAKKLEEELAAKKK